MSLLLMLRFSYRYRFGFQLALRASVEQRANDYKWIRNGGRIGLYDVVSVSRALEADSILPTFWLLLTVSFPYLILSFISRWVRGFTKTFSY